MYIIFHKFPGYKQKGEKKGEKGRRKDKNLWEKCEANNSIKIIKKQKRLVTNEKKCFDY